MPDNVCKFDAPDVAQVQTFQVTANDVATTYRVTMNGKTVSAAGNAGGANSTASDLKTALAASTIAEFKEVTWTVSTSTITGTAATAGVPFTFTVSVSGGAGTLSAITTVTTSKGKHHADDPANWSLGAVPVAGDTVYLQNSSTDLKYGLTALAAVTPADVYIDASYTGGVGLPDVNASGGYREYRQKFWQINGVTGACYVGKGAGSGSGRLKLDFRSAAVTINVELTGTPSDQNQKALTVIGSHANNVLEVNKGSVALAPQAGDTANFPTVRVGSIKSVSTDVDLYVGRGCSAVTTLSQNGGNVVAEVAVGTLTKIAGDFTILGAATMGTVTNDGGNYYWQSSGTMTTGTFRGDTSKLDCSRDNSTRAATTLTVREGATLNDPMKTVSSLAFATDMKSLAKSNIGAAPFTVTRS